MIRVAIGIGHERTSSLLHAAQVQHVDAFAATKRASDSLPLL